VEWPAGQKLHRGRSACGLPYYVEGLFSDVDELIKTPVGVPRTPAFFEKVKGVKVLTQMEALKIDPAKKAVRVKNLETGAEEDMAYDKLVLATGLAMIHSFLCIVITFKSIAKKSYLNGRW